MHTSGKAYNCLQEWRSIMQGDKSSFHGQDKGTPTFFNSPQPDIMYCPEGPSSFTSEHEAEQPPGTVSTGAVWQGYASDASNVEGSGGNTDTPLHHGGTLIVAPPSVVNFVWAPELVSKVLCCEGFAWAPQFAPLPIC